MKNEPLGIQVSSKYEDFILLEANRTISKHHVQELIKSFSDTPDIARTHPILVNDKMEIIDGQHRFVAWQEMKWPIYYIIEKGLTVHDALRLNSNQKAWKMADYAHAYASSGNISYQLFLQLIEEFGMPYKITQVYCEGYERTKATYRFKRGELKVQKDKHIVRERLEMLGDIKAMYPGHGHVLPAAFGIAMLTAFKNPEYNHDFFLEKFKLIGDKTFTNFSGSRNDFLRAVEGVYNYYTSPADSIRLF